MSNGNHIKRNSECCCSLTFTLVIVSSSFKGITFASGHMTVTASANFKCSPPCCSWGQVFRNPGGQVH